MMRTLELNDLFHLEHVGGALGESYAWSPDGRLLAVVVQRPRNTVQLWKFPRLQGMDRADVWLFDVATNESRNLTEGVSDGSGWWAPSWSRGGDHLAMLSTRGGGVHLWTWNRSSSSFCQETGQDLRLQFGGQPFAWIDDHRLVCSVLPEGVRPLQMTLESRAADRAMAMWPRAWQGQHPTASVLRSGAAATLVECDASLVIVDIRAAERVITELATGLARWPIAPDLALAPDRSAVACLTPIAPSQPSAEDRLRFSSPYRYRVNVTALDGAFHTAADGLTDVLEGTLVWSPDSAQVGCIAFASGRVRRSTEAGVYLIQPSSANVSSLGGDLLDMIPDEEDPQLRWTSDARLIVRASCPLPTANSETIERRDWWLLSANAAPHNLTASLNDPPSDLLAGPARRYFLGVADSQLWRIPINGHPEPVETKPAVTDIAWPSRLWRSDATTRATAEHAHLVVRAGHGEETTYTLVRADDGTSSVLSTPEPTAELRAVDLRHQRAVFSRDTKTGSRLWLSALDEHSSDAPRLIRESNVFLEEITMAACRLIEYRSLDGDVLKGWLMVPSDYQPGTRYPTVTWVYPGTVVSEQRPWLMQLAGDPSLNLHLLAAAGYAVLMPSMPTSAERMMSDPMLDLPNGVLPAVDHLVERGIADPDRLYLMGHSFGGYAVYGLVTQTHRFRAAVAMSGISNLISNYGGFDVRSRYEEQIDTQFFTQAWTESGQPGMGSPPWSDLGRYLRNSPLFAVDRVQTPLLILHTDLDFLGLQQAEEFFGALYRLGKPAEFVRYWGESHVLESPANIRDCWQRVVAWLELHRTETQHLSGP